MEEKKEKLEVRVRVNEKQMAQLEKLAEKTGFNKSELVRYLIVFATKDIPDKKDIKRLIRELSAIGNNLNQIARALNRHNIESKELAETFKQAISEVYELMNKLESFKK